MRTTTTAKRTAVVQREMTRAEYKVWWLCSGIGAEEEGFIVSGSEAGSNYSGGSRGGKRSGSRGNSGGGAGGGRGSNRGNKGGSGSDTGKGADGDDEVFDGGAVDLKPFDDGLHVGAILGHGGDGIISGTTKIGDVSLGGGDQGSESILGGGDIRNENIVVGERGSGGNHAIEVILFYSLGNGSESLFHLND